MLPIDPLSFAPHDEATSIQRGPDGAMPSTVGAHGTRALLNALKRRAAAGAGEVLPGHFQAASAFVALRAVFDEHPIIGAVFTSDSPTGGLALLFEVQSPDGMGERCDEMDCALALENRASLDAHGSRPPNGLRSASPGEPGLSMDGSTSISLRKAALAELKKVEALLREAIPALDRRGCEAAPLWVDFSMSPSHMAKVFGCPRASALIEALEIEAATPEAASSSCSPSL